MYMGNNAPSSLEETNKSPLGKGIILGLKLAIDFFSL